MRARRMIEGAVIGALLTATSFGAELTPSAILQKVEAAYKSMQTYQAEGTITSDIDTGAMKMTIETSFSILLKKPNLYVVSWTQKNMPMPGMEQSGAVWSDGTQPYLYMGIMKAYSKMTSDEMALSSATGISGGAAFTIPSLFLSTFKGASPPFSSLKDPTVEKVEPVGGEDCYVLTGPSAMSKKETFWISKTTYLIRKYCRSLEPPEGGSAIPEMTDEQLEDTIKDMGQEVTEESKKNMREMMERSKAILKTAKLKGSSTEVHANISSPELDTSTFTVALPEGTVLKDSLFGGMFSGNKKSSTNPIQTIGTTAPNSDL